MRSAATCLWAVFVLLSFDGPAAGQATAEYGAATGNAAGSAGMLKNLTDTVKAALGFDKTTKPASEPASTTVTPSLAAKTAPPAAKARARVRHSSRTPIAKAQISAPPPHYEDPRQIEVGMKYDELRRRFGPPLLEVTNGPFSKTLSYMSKGGPVQVDFSNDLVTSAQKPKL